MKWNDIVGHEEIIKRLRYVIEKDSLSNSYLFEGPESLGKSMVALAFSEEILGDNKTDLNVVKTDDSSIKKSQIEEVQRDIGVKPFKGNKKIYVILEAEKMTAEAQNSFLKTLEEPPHYAIIVLVTENSEKLLPTIVSRCQRIVFNYVEEEKIKDHLRHTLNETEERARFLSRFSNGMIGKAITLSFDKSFEKLREDTLSVISAVIEGDAECVFSSSKFFETHKEDIKEVLDIILLYFRDLVVFSNTTDTSLLINADKVDIMKKHREILQKNSLHDIINTILETRKNIDLKVNFLLNIENMLLEIQKGRVYGSSSRNQI